MFCDASNYYQLAEALKELPFNVKEFTIDGQIEGSEPVERLFDETGDENCFV